LGNSTAKWIVSVDAENPRQNSRERRPEWRPSNCLGDDRTVFEQTFKNIDDILHKDAGCTSELDYTEQSSWLLFLKYLDALEQDKAAEAELEGKRYTFILCTPRSSTGTIRTPTSRTCSPGCLRSPPAGSRSCCPIAGGLPSPSEGWPADPRV